MVVLDEPNSNLDVAGEQALIETLDRLKEANVTVILIAQRPNIMMRMDKILVLQDGAVRMFSDREEILKRLKGPVAVARDHGAPQSGPLTVGDKDTTI